MNTMNTLDVLRNFEEITGYYLEQLKNLSMEQLLHKPSENEWSIGQLYVHLVNTTLYMQLRNIELCRDASAPSVQIDGVKNEAGTAFFSQGSFPPISIQVPPSPQYTPKQPESKEELADGLKRAAAAMKETVPFLDSIPANHTVAHPGLGNLNAAEWFQLADMHYRHHLRQLDRLKAVIA
jgi:hypothetical protein